MVIKVALLEFGSEARVLANRLAWRRVEGMYPGTQLSAIAVTTSGGAAPLNSNMILELSRQGKCLNSITENLEELIP